MKRNRRLFVLRASFAIVSFFLTLALSELWLRVFASPKAILTDSDFWRIHWVGAHRSFSSGDPLQKNYLFDAYHPLLGWVPKPNYRSETVTINSKGLRGRKEYPTQKKRSETRIIALGDSFTFGEGVGDEETYPFFLEGLLKTCSVLNLGVHGYGTDQAYLYLKTEGFQYSPDLVILGIFVAESPWSSSVYRNVLSFRDYAKPRFVAVGDRLVLRNVPVPPPEVIARAPFPGPATSYLWNLFKRGVVSKTFFSAERQSRRITTRILDQMLAELTEHQAKFLIVTIPSGIGDPQGETELVLHHWAERRGVPILHLREAFLELEASQRKKVYAVHWTPFGNRAVAGILKRKLIEEGLAKEAQNGLSSVHTLSEKIF